MKTYTTEEIKEIIELEGLEYGLNEYLVPAQIKDDTLRSLVQEYTRYHQQIACYLEERGEEVDCPFDELVLQDEAQKNLDSYKAVQQMIQGYLEM